MSQFQYLLSKVSIGILFVSTVTLTAACAAPVPTATPSPTATPVPTATPPPTATLVPTATPAVKWGMQNVPVLIADLPERPRSGRVLILQGCYAGRVTPWDSADEEYIILLTTVDGLARMASHPTKKYAGLAYSKSQGQPFRDGCYNMGVRFKGYREAMVMDRNNYYGVPKMSRISFHAYELVAPGSFEPVN